MKDVIKLICHLPPTSCELSAFKNCVIRNAVGEEKLSKASLADVLYEVELTAFKLQSVLQHRSHHMLSACKLCQLEWCRHYTSNERQETFLHTTLKRQKNYAVCHVRLAALKSSQTSFRMKEEQCCNANWHQPGQKFTSPALIFIQNKNSWGQQLEMSKGSTFFFK